MRINLTDILKKRIYRLLGLFLGVISEDVKLEISIKSDKYEFKITEEGKYNLAKGVQ